MENLVIVKKYRPIRREIIITLIGETDENIALFKMNICVAHLSISQGAVLHFKAVGICHDHRVQPWAKLLDLVKILHHYFVSPRTPTPAVLFSVAL